MPSDKPSVIIPSPRPTAVRAIQLINRVKEMQILKKAIDLAFM